MSRPRRDAVRGARALAPAVEDAPVRTRDDARSSDSSEDEARARRRDKHLTTQKFVESIANAKGALLAEDVERLYAARCEEVAHDGRDQSDTESDASEEERGKWWPLTAVTTPKSAAEACAAEAKRAEEEGIVPEGTMATSELMIHNWLHLSESLTRWRRAGTMVLTPPPDELRCHTCRDFAAEPLVNAQGRLFCAPCGRENEGDARAKLFGLDVQTQMRLDALPVMCCNVATPHAGGDNLVWKVALDGCRAVSTLGKVRAHEETCEYTLMRCSLPAESTNKAEKCHAVVPRRTMDSHRATCEYRIQKCADCDRSVQVRKMRAHVMICGQIEVHCPYRRCKWRGARDGVDAHVATECLLHPVVCRLEDSETRETCKETVPRERIAQHRASCQYQQRPCEYCTREVSLRRMGDHKLRCKAREFQCPLCRRIMPAEQRESHEKTTCPMIESVCEHARFGCDVKVPKEHYRQHAIECFPEHVAHVAFGTDGVSEFVSAPSDDQVDAVELLKRMQRNREAMLADFASFETMCHKVSCKLNARAELCSTASHAAKDVEETTAAFERQAERERCASAFALREKHSLDRDEDYNDMIVSRNLVGARIIDEMRRFDETTAKLRLKSEALYAALDEKRDFATRRLEDEIDAHTPAADLIADAKDEATKYVATVDAERRRLAARLIDMKSNVFSAKMSLVENVEHRKRRSETLRAKLTAFARGERFVDGDGVHATHS